MPIQLRSFRLSRMVIHQPNETLVSLHLDNNVLHYFSYTTTATATTATATTATTNFKQETWTYLRSSQDAQTGPKTALHCCSIQMHHY